MKARVCLLLTIVFLIGVGSCQSEKKKTTYFADINTRFGDITIRLYNSTPEHRDNFVKLAEEGFYDYLLFHRVVKNFVVQGGDPDSRDAHQLDQLGAGEMDYLLDAEIGAVHLKGAVGAARKDDHLNPDRKSSGCQFYIVQGTGVTEAELDQWEAKKGIKYTPAQRALYLEKGGLPFLDMEYTVFGEVVSGLDVIDRMAMAPIARFDRPSEDIRMVVKIRKETTME